MKRINGGVNWESKKKEMTGVLGLVKSDTLNSENTVKRKPPPKIIYN